MRVVNWAGLRDYRNPVPILQSRQPQNPLSHRPREFRFPHFRHPPFNDIHDRGAIEHRAHWVDVQLKMRDSDAELEQDDAIGARHIEKRTLGDFPHPRELLRLAG